MPWQRQVLNVALEHDRDGRMAYRTVVVTVPRQNGKTSLLWSLMAWWAMTWPKSAIVATAQSGVEAYEKWREYAELVEASDFTADQVREVRRSNGSEAITWANGSRHRVRAPTARAAHGITLDLGVIDEAWALRDEVVLQSFRPAMVTRPNAQLWIVSTAGTADSLLLRRHVEMGRASVESGDRNGLAYFEWSAPDDMASSDVAALRVAMPALGHTITEEIVLADRGTLTPGEYERAYLNRWTDTIEAAVPLALWTLVQEPDAEPRAPVWLGVDMTPERDAASIVAAGWWRERVAVEVVDHHAGVGWLPERLAELVARHSVAGLVVDGGGPIAALVGDFPIDAVSLNYRQVQAASGQLYDGITTGALAVRPHASLDLAVRGAAKLGTGDVWRWGRKRSASDVCPLVAATVAYHQARAERGGTLRIW
jgi:phage terminase large subunit-like protein